MCPLEWYPRTGAGPLYPTLTLLGHPLIDFLTLLSSPFGFLHSGWRRTYLQLSGLTNSGLCFATLLLTSRSISRRGASESFSFNGFLGIFLSYQPFFFS